MNGSIIRRQLRSNLLSGRMAIIIVLSVGMIVMQWWTTHRASFVLYDHEPTFLADVMLFSQFGSGAGLYLFLMPFLAALLGGSLVAEERHWKRAPFVISRCDRPIFLCSSLCAGFLLGGIGGLMPLALNMLIMGIINPHMNFIEGTEWDETGLYLNRYVLVSSKSWAYPLYERNQWLCVAIICLLVFVISGLFATLAISSSLFIRRRHMELLVPFTLSLLWWLFTTSGKGGRDQWTHIIFLNFAPATVDELHAQNYVGIALSIILLLLATSIPLLIKGRQDVS